MANKFNREDILKSITFESNGYKGTIGEQKAFEVGAKWLLDKILPQKTHNPKIISKEKAIDYLNKGRKAIYRKGYESYWHCMALEFSKEEAIAILNCKELDNDYTLEKGTYQKGCDRPMCVLFRFKGEFEETRAKMKKYNII